MKKCNGKLYINIEINNNRGESYDAVVTGKFTNETFEPLNMGGSWTFGSAACLALIHRDSVVLASFSNLLRLLISAFSTCRKPRI